MKRPPPAPTPPTHLCCGALNTFMDTRQFQSKTTTWIGKGPYPLVGTKSKLFLQIEFDGSAF